MPTTFFSWNTSEFFQKSQSPGVDISRRPSFLSLGWKTVDWNDWEKFLYYPSHKMPQNRTGKWMLGILPVGQTFRREGLGRVIGDSKSLVVNLPPTIMVQWKMGPSNISFLSFRVIFHFYDNGKKGNPILCKSPSDWKSPPRVVKNRLWHRHQQLVDNEQTSVQQWKT